jgi:hypothetical protein
MSVKLYNCDCLYEEVNNNINDSLVKGYTLISECNTCKTIREGQEEQRAIEEQAASEAEIAKEEKKASAKIKLLALGLTEEEIEAILS